MGEWERYGGRDGGYGEEGRGNRANSWRSSPQSRAFGTSFDVVQEKKFCEYLSSIKWGRLYHVQKYTHMYKNVLQWDDTGALESFQAARSRFNAKESGEPCNNALPDPDMYIDQINHDCVIDQELIDDLEKELVSQETNKACQQTATGTNGWDSVGCSDRHVLATGWESWGDSVDKEKEKDNSNNWDVYVENNKPEQCTGWGNSEWFDDPWERENNNATGWGNNNNMSSSSAWANEDSNNGGWNNLWNNNSWNDDSWYRRRNDPNSRYGRKRDVSINNGGFKVRKVRYTGDRCQPGNNWRGPRGRNNNRHYPYNAAFS